VDTTLVKVGGWWGHRKSGGQPVGRVEPVVSAGVSVAYSAGTLHTAIRLLYTATHCIVSDY